MNILAKVKVNRKAIKLILYTKYLIKTTVSCNIVELNTS